MVFDWFQRRLSQSQAGQPSPEAEPSPSPAVASEPEPESSGGEAATATPPAATPAATTLSATDTPASAPRAEAPAAPSPATPEAPAAPGIDADALAWAREAYARLKAQQQPSQPVDQSAPAPAPSPPPAPADEVPPSAAQATVATPEVSPAPAAEASQPPAATSLSLLERAAAERERRQREVLAAAAAAPGVPLAEPPAPEASPAPLAPPTAAAAAPTQAEADLQLGDFDEEFTWSAEVLAAQGRRVDEVSLEEIDWLTRLRRGMEKTRRGFVNQLLERLGDDPLTPELLDDLESTLLRADVGVQATDLVLDALRARLNQEVVDGDEGVRILKEQLRDLLDKPIQTSGRDLLAPERDRLNIWLMVGVNGVGKTTTLGKLANLAVRSGYSCLIAAADTFRAAAVQQVTIWGERSGVPVISNPSANADPAAVVYDAINSAKAKGTELLLVDTAGRLQTKHNLMEELSKIRRIVDKLAPEAAVESLLVLDASQGQNGLRQAMAFAKAAGLTGVVITKLDGSSRGGVALAVCHEVGLPIRFIGAGEGLRDLRPFNSFEFVEALMGS
jgi:fused signal recognition particle receptor